jgi:hypothetical protein
MNRIRNRSDAIKCNNIVKEMNSKNDQKQVTNFISRIFSFDDKTKNESLH